jgi:D-glycerate 3-kinase
MAAAKSSWQVFNPILDQQLADWLVDRVRTEHLQPDLEQQLLRHPLTKNFLAENLLTENSPTENSLTEDLPNLPKVDQRLMAQRLLAQRLLAERVQTQLQQVRSLAPALDVFCQKTFAWKRCPLDLLWNVWLPLALQIQQWHQALNHPLVQGILGGQGTGKTTLSRILAYILEQMGLQVCRLSIDDLYKTYAERQQLQQHDPRFRWRGPPGTHDIQLGLTVLHQLRHPQPSTPIAIPRFDKSLHHGAGDRTTPEWITRADIVLFEGWFVGIRPIDPTIFETAPPPIVTEADRAFARDINTHLQDYLPLWQQLDRLILLYPEDYRLSQQWRQQAEAEMIAAGKTGMSAIEIQEFVAYFWKALHPLLFIAPLRQDAERVDLVIEINAEHYPEQLYCPSQL